MACDLGKLCFPTRAEANAQLQHLRKKRGRGHAYYCKDCQAWHMSTKKRKKKYDRRKIHNPKTHHARQREQGY